MDDRETSDLRERLAAFLATQTGCPVAIPRWQRFTVGFWWATVGFDAGWDDGGAQRAHALVLRQAPAYGIFDRYAAHDQFIILDALAASGVPLPRVYWYSDDPRVLGTPFFIMERSAGEALLPWTTAG